MKVLMTPRRYDDIASILDEMSVGYDDYVGFVDTDDLSEYQILVLNCGTDSHPQAMAIKEFVNKGGVLYASDWTNEILIEAFGSLMEFEHIDNTYDAITAKVKDDELKEIIGAEVEVRFDTGDWRLMRNHKAGTVILSVDLKDLDRNDCPIMVEVPYGLSLIHI